MIAIIWQTLKRKKISLLTYSLAGILFMWMFVAMYPSFADESEKLQEAFSSYPEEFFQAFNIQPISFDKVENFLALENFSIMWPLLILFMVIAFAGTSLAGEIEKGTLSMALSRPVSRLKIFVAKYLAGALAVLVFTVLSIFFIIPLSSLHNVEYVLESYTTVAVLGFLFGMAIFSMSMLFSAIFSEKSKVYMAMGGIMFIMYVFNVIVNMRESLNNLKYFSFFYYYDYNSALFDFVIPNESLIIFISTIVISFIAGLAIFRRRDIAI